MVSVLVMTLLVALAYSDLRRRRLPNRLVGMYAVLCPVALWASGAAPATWLQHGLVALLGFVFFLALFVLGGMGGGDVKLATAVLGWTGVSALSQSLLLIALTGLMLAVIGVTADKLSGSETKNVVAARTPWEKALFLLSAKRGVPYGVALAMGGMASLPVYWRY